MASPRPAEPWRTSRLTRVLLDSLYGFSAIFVVWVFFALTVAGLALSAGLAIVVIGPLVLVGTTYVARTHAFFERLRLQGMLHRPAPTPTYLRAPADGGFWRRALTSLRDPQSWLDVLWSLISPITGTAAFVVVVTWWAGILGGLTYWFWQRYLPDGDGHHGLAWLLGLGDSRTAESLLNLVVGGLLLVTLPAVMRGVALLHGGLATALLCSRADLQQQVARAESGREAGRAAEATALRRLERDIHDGPQQRLVRLGMDLGRARRAVGTDPQHATDLIDGALEQAREAVAELRSLSRGVAPPLLVDRGLGAALGEMLTHAPVPVESRVDVPDRLPAHVETAVYFVVSESLTNIAKHSRADRAAVEVTVVDDAVRVRVMDDGVGGAEVAKGHGLAGLQQRLAAVDGTFELTSPDGGPTVLVATVPLTTGGAA